MKVTWLITAAAILGVWVGLYQWHQLTQPPEVIELPTLALVLPGELHEYDQEVQAQAWQLSQAITESCLDLLSELPSWQPGQSWLVATSKTQPSQVILPTTNLARACARWRAVTIWLPSQVELPSFAELDLRYRLPVLRPQPTVPRQ